MASSLLSVLLHCLEWSLQHTEPQQHGVNTGSQHSCNMTVCTLVTVHAAVLQAGWHGRPCSRLLHCSLSSKRQAGRQGMQSNNSSAEGSLAQLQSSTLIPCIDCHSSQSLAPILWKSVEVEREFRHKALLAKRERSRIFKFHL